MKAIVKILLFSTAPGVALGQEFSPQGTLVRPGIDSLAVFFIDGPDTTRTGTIRDEITFVMFRGQRVLHRVYQTKDRVLGARLDTLVDDASSLEPVLHRSRNSSALEFLDFGNGRVAGWMRLANGDSAAVDTPLPGKVFNASTFDLVLRGAPLSEELSFKVPTFLPSTRSVVSLSARVAGTDVVDGEAVWRVQADFGGTPVTFWISKESRQLKRQLMQLRPDRAILFSRPSGFNHPHRSSN